MTRDESVDTAPYDCPLPDIAAEEDFRSVIKKLSIAAPFIIHGRIADQLIPISSQCRYFRSVIELPSTFEQLRTTTAGACLRDLAIHLGATCDNPLIVNALLHTLSAPISLLFLLTPCSYVNRRRALKWHYDTDRQQHDQTLSDARASACEIVAWRFLARLSDADALRFCLVVQRIVAGIWHGEIIFWDSLSVHATKTPRLYDPHKTDLYSRLRVPKYLKTFEALFFLVFLYLYYTVLIQRVSERVTATEAVLWVWIAAFCYDEFSEWLDAGSVFYVTDIWNVCDLIMMLLGCVFAVLRIIGVVQQSTSINNTAFDILALEALFLVPRMCSLLSLNPSWGILIPCLKEMTIDFVKFMVIILIIYCGFLTTFSLLGRDHFTLVGMAGVLGKIFFGSSYVGLDIMHDIDPVFGPPLMIVFITMSTFLLMGSLAGLLANSFARVMDQAHLEYVYVYSVYVLEASTSNRLTHFYPPFNLLALLVFRPWRLVLRSDDTFRGGRIWLLKATHTPIVAVIRLYEMLTRRSTVKGLPQLPGGSILHPAEGFGRPESRRDTARAERGRKRTRRRRTVLHSQERTAVEQDAGEAKRVALEAQIGDLNRKLDKLTDIVIEMKRSEESRRHKQAT
ncbi:hypothetical protein LLEC1_05176 [Akanthomyces lecanii]|uniref:Calcium channel YVC1-like C-terminal transmembrane domain-containing protein n=1 Tax=Cordyceps confragosa TaxID=2714763 RepID=A0A179I9Q0_CORDF|nr:hypothetical protein LLEC1_05176 [Akanthomyces lecanii]